jgi:hypothetical protein
MVQNCVISLYHLLNGWQGKKYIHNFGGRTPEKQPHGRWGSGRRVRA